MTDSFKPPRATEPTEASPPHKLPSEEQNHNSNTRTANDEASRTRRSHLIWSQHPQPFGLPPHPISPTRNRVGPASHPRVPTQTVSTRANEPPAYRHHFRSSSQAHPHYNYLQNEGSADAQIMPLDLLDDDPNLFLETHWQYEAAISRTHEAAQQEQQQDEHARARPRTQLNQVSGFRPAEELGIIHAPVTPPWHAITDAPVGTSWTTEERQGWIETHLIAYQTETDQDIAIVDRTFIIYNPVDGTPDDDPFLTVIPVSNLEECGICQQVFVEAELAVKLPCGHCYHRDCIARWFVEYAENTCPLCRQAFNLKRMPTLQLVVDPNEN